MPVSNTDNPVELPPPIILFPTKYHRAAVDGLINVASTASSKDANLKDKEGLSPTLWAAFFGNIDVLQVFVSRGGTPSKFDRYGNTALHLAASGGHATCVSFLIDMGENVWALNMDKLTPRDLAASSRSSKAELALRLLDDAMAKETALNPRRVKIKKQRAEQRAKEVFKEFQRQTTKNKKLAEEEFRIILERSQNVFDQTETDGKSVRRHSDAALPQSTNRRHSDASLASSTATAATGATSSTIGSVWSALRLQALQQAGRRASNNSKVSHLSNTSSMSLSSTQFRNFEFKVGTLTQDGSRTAKNLPGIASNTEVLFSNGLNPSRRSSILSTGSTVPLDSVSDAFELAQRQEGRIVIIPPRNDSDTEDDAIEFYQKNSMFDRPGFGTMAFRHSVSGEPNTLFDGQRATNWNLRRHSSADVPDGTLEEEDEENEFDDEEEKSPMDAFLFTWDLTDLKPQLSFIFKDDLDELLACDENDERLMCLPLGKKKKLLKIIEIRNEAINSPSSPDDVETKL